MSRCFIYDGMVAWFVCMWLAGVWPVCGGETNGMARALEIQQRSTNEFLEANFFKPIEPLNPGLSGLSFKLAPLIIQEVKAGEPEDRGGSEGGGVVSNGSNRAADQFGSLGLSNGLAVVVRSSLAMFVSSDIAELQGRRFPRFTYVWFYSTEGRSEGGEGRLPVQGVRITLNSQGDPVIWEVLADPGGVEIVFVAQSLEAAAQAEFGKPLPGRRYAIERSVEDAPNVVVARVIEDGPVAMGPIVYLSAQSRAVSTLICRCMPAQAKKLLATANYELRAADAGSNQVLLAKVRGLLPAKLAFWPGDVEGERRVEKWLRLPGRL